MKTVGLRELKNRLGVYMRHVRRGEIVAITDRGQVVAELSPPRSKDDPASALDAMARRGEATLGRKLTKRERVALYTAPRPVLHGGVASSDLLDAERGDR
jgi:antitoxin (DNA-binding transcriptional repressor) of toxin-antitoxin stability system